MAGPSSGTLELPRFTRPPHVMIVEARFYTDLADELARGAIAELEAAGATYERFAVAGAFELPVAIRVAIQAAERGTLKRPFDGFVALGCVIRGETTHYDYVCGESARGLQDLALAHGAAIGYGVLTVENEAQAWARARVTEQNKGGDVARACLGVIGLRQRFGLFPR
ncbi:MAG: 6,7-dimethyl-8-ribityllumazine synthase [Reyranellaceae bacterium]